MAGVLGPGFLLVSVRRLAPVPALCTVPLTMQTRMIDRRGNASHNLMVGSGTAGGRQSSGRLSADDGICFIERRIPGVLQRLDVSLCICVACNGLAPGPYPVHPYPRSTGVTVLYVQYTACVAGSRPKQALAAGFVACRIDVWREGEKREKEREPTPALNCRAWALPPSAPPCVCSWSRHSLHDNRQWPWVPEQANKACASYGFLIEIRVEGCHFGSS